MTPIQQSVAPRRVWVVAAPVMLLGLVMPLASNGTVVVLFLIALAAFSPTALRGKLRAVPTELLLGLLILSVWIVASAFWSPLNDPGKALRTVGLFLLGLVFALWMLTLSNAYVHKGPVRKAIVVAMVVAAIVFIVEGVSGAALTRVMRGEGASAIDINLERVGRGTTLFAILMWPTVVAIAGRNRIAGLMFLAVAVTAVALLPMNAALLGGLLGAVALFAARLAPRTTLAVLGVIFCLYAGFAPSLSLDVVTLDGFRKHVIELPAAWVHRVGIWTFAAEQSGLYAPRGAGFDAARAIGREGHVIEELRSQLGYAPAAMPLHPHNALLQIWLELGIAGVIAICLIFVGFLRGVWQLRACPWHCAAGCAGLVAALPPLVLSFGVWQTWWIAALCLSAAMSVGLLAIDRHRDAWDRATTPPTVHKGP